MRRNSIFSLAVVSAAFWLGAAADVPAQVQGERAQAAADYASEQMRTGGVPGFAIGIVQGPQVLFARGYGRADGSGMAATADTPFILGSTSKSFTALCVMQLVDARLIRLDEHVETYLPGFMEGRAPITVRMLLNQTSGISHAAGDQPILSPGPEGDDAIRSWAMALKPTAINRSVGEAYEYSNANFVVLGAVIEAASGETYAHYLHTHVFEPLGMHHSYTSIEEARRAGLAQGHREWFGWFEAGDVPYPPSFIPVGFIISSVSDMTRYLAMEANGGELDGNRLISGQGLAEMHRGVAAMDPDGKAHYAMGWVDDTFNGVPVVFHDGDTGRFTSLIAISRQERFGVVILANGSGWLYGPHLTDAANGAINILAGKTPKSYADVYVLTKVILGVIVSIALLQLLFAVRALLVRHRWSLLWGYLVPAVLNTGLAVALAYALPRLAFGIPLVELVASLPEMGVSALVSAASALVWLVLTALRLARGAPAR